MIGDTWGTLYYQRYQKGDEVAYCPICEDQELVVDDPTDEYNFCICPCCHSAIYRDQILWKEAEKDSEHNIPTDAYQYHALFVIQQGQGNYTNIKYRTYLEGKVDEFDKLQRLIRQLKPLTAATLIQILESSQDKHRKGRQ